MSEEKMRSEFEAAAEEHFWLQDLRRDYDKAEQEYLDEIVQTAWEFWKFSREALQAECEQLRKDAEFGRSVLAKREPGKRYGCHCDLDEGVEPDACVFDTGEHHYCIYAKDILVKEQCSYWRVIASDATHRKQGGEA